MSTNDSVSTGASQSQVLASLLRTMGVDLRAGEGRAAALLFFGFFFSLIFQYAAKTIRQSTFVDSVGAVNLPWVYLAVALGSFPLLKRLSQRLRALAVRSCLVTALRQDFTHLAFLLLTECKVFGKTAQHTMRIRMALTARPHRPCKWHHQQASASDSP